MSGCFPNTTPLRLLAIAITLSLITGCALLVLSPGDATIASRIADLCVKFDSSDIDSDSFVTEIAGLGKPASSALTLAMQSTIDELDQRAMEIKVPRGRAVWEVSKGEAISRCRWLAYRYLLLFRAFTSIHGDQLASEVFCRQVLSATQEVSAALTTGDFGIVWFDHDQTEASIMVRLLHSHPSPMARKGFVQSVAWKSYGMPLLVEALSDADASVRVEACRLLARQQDFAEQWAKVKLLVTPAIQSSNLVTRILAIKLLGEDDIEMLRSAVTNGFLEAEVRTAALEGLNHAIMRAGEDRLTIQECTGHFDMLRKTLLHEVNSGLKIEALRGLSSFSSQESVDAIAIALEDTNEDVTMNAVYALVSYYPGPSNRLEKLRNVLATTNASPIVVATAAQAFGRSGQPEIMIGYILSALRRETNSSRRAEILDMLSETRTRAAEEILTLMLHSDDVPQRFLAACSLGRHFKSRAGIEILLDFSSDIGFDNEERRFEALANVGTRADIPVLNTHLLSMQGCGGRGRDKRLVADLIDRLERRR